MTLGEDPSLGELASLKGPASASKVRRGQTGSHLGYANGPPESWSQVWTHTPPLSLSPNLPHGHTLPPVLCKGPEAASLSPSPAGTEAHTHSSCSLGQCTCMHAHTHSYTHTHPFSRRGWLPKVTQLPPTSQSPSNIRADLRVSSNSSVCKGLGATAGLVSREDHSQHNDSQCQPQPQQDQADQGPAVPGHGSVAQEEREGWWADRGTDGWADEWTRRHTDRLTDNWTDGQTGGATDRHEDGSTDRPNS